MNRFQSWNAYRAAAVVLLVFCVLHSYGALLSTPHFGAASDTVVESMRAVRFSAQGFTDTWYGFYLGFGWFSSILFAISGLQLWVIGGRDLATRRSDRTLVWLLAIGNAIGVGLCARYFFPAALVFSIIVTFAIFYALLHDSRMCRKVAAQGGAGE
jgi:hypothetical protein